MSSFEIQRLGAMITSVQKEFREMSEKHALASGVSLEDVQREVQTAYVRMMVSVDTSLAEIKTRLDELERRPAPVVDMSELIARIEKVEAVPKMAKATEILARLDRLEAAAAATAPAPSSE